MPAARPSRPSMKLIALMVITTSRMVSVTLRSGSSENTPPPGVGTQGRAWPLHTRMPAAATWPASLLQRPLYGTGYSPEGQERERRGLSLRRRLVRGSAGATFQGMRRRGLEVGGLGRGRGGRRRRRRRRRVGVGVMLVVRDHRG